MSDTIVNRKSDTAKRYKEIIKRYGLLISFFVLSLAFHFNA